MTESNTPALICKTALRRYLKTGDIATARQVLGLKPGVSSTEICEQIESEIFRIAFLADDEFVKYGPSGKDKTQALYWLQKKYAPLEETQDDAPLRVVLEIPSNGRGPTAHAIDTKETT